MKRVLKFWIAVVVVLFISESVSAQGVSFTMGKRQIQKNNYAEALRYLEFGWARDSSKVENLEAIILCHSTLRNYAEELKYRQKLMELSVDDSDNILRAAALLMDKGDQEGWSLLGKYNQLVAMDQQIDSDELIEQYSVSHSRNSRYSVSTVDGNSAVDDIAPILPIDGGLVFSSNRDSSIFVNRKHGFNNARTLNLYRAALPSTSLMGSVEPYLKGERRRLHEGAVAFTPDSSYAFITMNSMNGSNALKNSKKIVPLTIKCYDLKAGDINSELTPSFINENYNFGHITFSEAGDYALFVSDMPGGFGGTDIWYVSYIDGKFGEPVNGGSVINTAYDECSPRINSDDVIYFSSNRLGGVGGLDIYSTSLDMDSDLSFAAPINLGITVNSILDDIDLVVNSDNSLGYFASNRDGGVGAYDIYSIRVEKPIVVEEPIVEVVEPIIEVDSAKIAVTAVRDVIKKFDLEHIYYDFDKYFLRLESKDRLNHLVDVMHEYPKISIKLFGHTDCRGTENYNQKLSEKRVFAAYSYLVKSGISKLRLSYEGMGELELINHCDDGVDCTPEEHQENRRTEFHVIYND